MIQDSGFTNTGLHLWQYVSIILGNSIFQDVVVLRRLPFFLGISFPKPCLTSVRVRKFDSGRREFTLAFGLFVFIQPGDVAYDERSGRFIVVSLRHLYMYSHWIYYKVCMSSRWNAGGHRNSFPPIYLLRTHNPQVFSILLVHMLRWFNGNTL